MTALTLSDYARRERLPEWMVRDAAEAGVLSGYARFNPDGEWLIASDAPRALCLPSSRMGWVSPSCYCARYGVSPVRLLTGLLIAGERGRDYVIAGGGVRVKNAAPDQFSSALADILMARGPRRKRGNQS